MRWPRFAKTPLLVQSAPVPDAEALRRAALQASWRRDRWVGQRRVAVRWTLWAARRYVLPALTATGALMWLGLQAVPWVLQRLDGAPETALPATAPAPAPQSMPMAASATPVATSLVARPEASRTETEPPLQLRLDAHTSDPTPLPRAPAPAPGADPSPNPDLKPENWLHSKEP